MRTFLFDFRVGGSRCALADLQVEWIPEHLDSYSCCDSFLIISTFIFFCDLILLRIVISIVQRVLVMS